MAPAVTHPPNQKILGAICTGVRRLGHQTDNSPPCADEMKHKWRYLSTYAIYNRAMDKSDFTITKKLKLKNKQSHVDRQHKQVFGVWIKIDQLMSLALFFAQHVSNASTLILRSLRLSVWEYCSGSMCVGVTVCFGWGGVVSVCRLRHWGIVGLSLFNYQDDARSNKHMFLVFDMHCTVHRCDNRRIRANWVLLMFCYTYDRLNMFRALLCPSSGAHDCGADYHIRRPVL